MTYYEMTIDLSGYTGQREDCAVAEDYTLFDVPVELYDAFNAAGGAKTGFIGNEQDKKVVIRTLDEPTQAQLGILNGFGVSYTVPQPVNSLLF